MIGMEILLFDVLLWPFVILKEDWASGCVLGVMQSALVSDLAGLRLPEAHVWDLALS